MFGLPALPWKWIGVGLAALAIVAAVWFAINAYGDARYDAGVTETDRKWEAAAAKAEKASIKAADTATEKAAVREADFAERTAAEKERIDETIKQGGDSFDVLFGSDNGLQ